MYKLSTPIASFLILVLLQMTMSCNDGVLPMDSMLKTDISVVNNPFGKVPLGALLKFETQKPCSTTISIDGNNPITRSFPDFKRFQEIPVIGLYPGKVNTVSITLTDQKGKKYQGTVDINTPEVPSFLPDISITKLDTSQMAPGYHLAEMLIANNGLFHSFTIMFDNEGIIRWYMDMSSTEKICYTPLRLKNGNWLYVSWIDIYELTELGQVVKKDQMWGHAGDHDIIELVNGNLLMGGSKKDAFVDRDGQRVGTRFDYVVEWERTPPGRAVKEWDIAEVLDIDRTVFPQDYSLDNKADWFHVNSIAQSKDDNCLIVSGRNQGVVKVNAQNKPIWILAPHSSWGKSGRSGNKINTKDLLLTAVDHLNTPYEQNVQLGTKATDSFEWSTGQHAISVLENGNIVMFDNGLSRNFEERPTYSRAVEYKIDEQNMNIQQVWQYGKERGLSMYSGITSDVDILPNGNRLITAGNIRLDSLPPHAKMIEIKYPSNEEVFEANIYFKDAKGSNEKSWAQFDLVYRGERYPLFSN